MSAPRCLSIGALAVLALVVGFGGSPATAAEPELRVRDNGRLVVRWDDGCRVRYDPRGRRISVERECSDWQLARSDDMVRRELAESGGGSGRMADPTFATRNGRTEARYPNGCRIEYDSNGRRRGSDRACTSAQLNRADRQAARRLGSSDGWGRTGDPTFEKRDGLTEAVFPNGCRVFYDEVGRRTDSNKACTPPQVQKADRELQRIWARDDGRGRAIGRPYVSASDSTTLIAQFPDGCNVFYTRRGAFQSMSNRCTTAHRTRADRDVRDLVR